MIKTITFALMLTVLLIWGRPYQSEAKTDIFTEAQKQEQKFFQKSTPDVHFGQVTEMLPNEEKAIECMALNIYHEARNESVVGQMAVAWVVMNRMRSERFPDTVCGVVYQARTSRWHRENTGKIVPIRNQCQFSWYCDGKSDKVYELDKFEDVRDIAKRVVSNDRRQYNKLTDITEGALWYHADYVNPKWSKDYVRTVKIGAHIFYKEK
jgi:spore germination cell wall hydrolase CwlJ-like protein